MIHTSTSQLKENDDYHQLPPLAAALFTEGDFLDRFLEYVASKSLELYPAQEEALLEIMSGKNVILNTPTGSGKSLIATAAHFKTLAEGKRSFYTCPIKALVSEKFFALCAEFGPNYIGMITGDASVNPQAPILCCTAEILANIALREGASAPVDFAILDEFHYYSDRERGVSWQIPLLTLPQTKFLLMSATMGNSEMFAAHLTKLTHTPTTIVRSSNRPVPLDFQYSETPLHETIATWIARGRTPIYIVNFTQRACAEEAQNLMSVDFCTREEKKAIAARVEGSHFTSPYGKELQKFLRHGIGLHHAGLLPKYRRLVEQLAQSGLLKIICGTDTLGVGVNIPIRTVLFTKLCKFDGEKTAILSIRDFQQISGRAGRKGFDDQGTVVVQAPEHVIENLRMEAKAGNEASKRKKIVKKKPPEKGYTHWDRNTFERLVQSAPEPLVSRFSVTHGMLLNVLQRPNNGCMAMARLLYHSHETLRAKREHAQRAKLLFQSLVDAGVVHYVETDRGRHVVVNIDLQDDFSLHHTLALYMLDTLRTLDILSPTYALDVLTLVESILENPDMILQKQLDRIKTEMLAELKAAGVEFEERMSELEKLEYPKPNRDFIYDTFNAFTAKHPWALENIRPKSIAREMYENGQTFAEYIKEYQLQRSEGLLLRYLSEVYKTLVQTVPELAKNNAVEDIEDYFGAIVRQVDSSLLDEWERLRDPSRVFEQKPAEEEPTQIDITRNARAFTVLIRNLMYRFLRALAIHNYEAAAAILVENVEGDALFAPTEIAWTAERLEEEMRPFYEEHSAIRMDQNTRNPQNTILKKPTPYQEQYFWELTQIISDAENENDWCIECVIDLDRSRSANVPVIELKRIARS